MQQVEDFREESQALCEVLDSLADADFAMATDFNNWSINDVLQHLHYFNVMADWSLTKPKEFAAEYEQLNELRTGSDLVTATEQRLRAWSGHPLLGRELLNQWRDTFGEMSDRWKNEDPKTRVKWVGPDMSVRSSITARLMETWAHGQEVYDRLGLERVNEDRIKNIVILGLNTYGWTFKNRGETPAQPVPFLSLTAPSGALWTWGEDNQQERIDGLAEEFCMVVTQTRNVQDTSLKATGPNAMRWMSVAQCFAGSPRNPPEPGSRRRR